MHVHHQLKRSSRYKAKKLHQRFCYFWRIYHDSTTAIIFVFKKKNVIVLYSHECQLVLKLQEKISKLKQKYLMKAANKLTLNRPIEGGQ